MCWTTRPDALDKDSVHGFPQTPLLVQASTSLPILDMTWRRRRWLTTVLKKYNLRNNMFWSSTSSFFVVVCYWVYYEHKAPINHVKAFINDLVLVCNTKSLCLNIFSWSLIPIRLKVYTRNLAVYIKDLSELGVNFDGLTEKLQETFLSSEKKSWEKVHFYAFA